MSVLVTGGAGYIGSHMVWELLDHGEEVVVLDRLSSGFDWAVPPEARLYVGDVGDSALVTRIIREHKVTAIIHFAGSLIVPESVSDPLLYYENNTCKTRSLIDDAVREGVPHFIFSSTAAVYGTAGVEPVQEDARHGARVALRHVEADDGVDPARHGSGVSRLRLHRAALFQRRRRRSQGAHRPVDAGRHAAHQGGRRDGARQAALHADLRHRLSDAGRNLHPRLHPCQRSRRRASAGAWSRLRAGGGSIVANCGYGHGYSVLEVMESVKRVYGGEIDVRITGRRPGDAVAVVANSDLARREFGWTPQFDDLDRIVSDALAWERILATKNWPNRA